MKCKIVLSESVSDILQREYKRLKQVQKFFDVMYADETLKNGVVSEASRTLQTGIKVLIAEKIIEFLDIYNNEVQNENS